MPYCAAETAQYGHHFGMLPHPRVYRLHIAEAYENRLTTLDVSGCPALEVLACAENRLANLNFSGCRRLITLSCHTNHLTTLALKGMTPLPQAVELLQQPKGTLATRIIPSEPIGREVRLPLDRIVSEPFVRDPDVRDLFPDRERTPIPFPSDEPPNRERPIPSGEFPNMQYIYCHTNELTELDVTSCPGLEKIWCNHNKLASLNIRGLSKLEYVACHHNLLPELNVNGCSSLEKIHCLSGQKTHFSITGLTQPNSPVLLY